MGPTNVNAMDNSSFSLAYDEDRNKKFPHCTSMFYHDKSLQIHIQHAHSNLIKSADSDRESDIPGLNNHINTEPVSEQNAETTNVNSINTHSNQIMNGINIDTNLSVNGLNNQTTPPDIMDRIVSDVVTMAGTDQNSQEQSVSPSTELEGKMERENPNHTEMTSKSDKSISGKIVNKSFSLQQFGHHKRHPKPKGKHCWPAIPTNDMDESTSAIKTGPKKIKSEFVTITHGVRKVKKICHFKCQLCKVVSSSQAEPNKHYRSNHPPLSCSQCSLTFSNLCSLRRHRYSPISLKFFCRFCEKGYTFESDLNNHKLKHQRHPGYQCNQVNNGRICGKWYFAKGDLTKHLKIHSGIVHQCYECNYTTYDIRYLRAHWYTHLDREKYRCPNCECSFKHHTQLKRHSEKC